MCEPLTSEDLVWIEADLRSQIYNKTCRDCRQRIVLADKIEQTRGGLPLSDDLIQRMYQKR